MKSLILVSLLLVTSAPAFAQAGQVRNGLPPTSMDSFVHEAAGNADLIYGDEGVVNIPPYDSFTVPHRINSGIFGVRNQGITTGHGSYLPDGWGGDEWTGNEWSMSGAGANPTTNPTTVTDNPADTPSHTTTNLPSPTAGQQPVNTGVGGTGSTTVHNVGVNNNPNQYSSGTSSQGTGN